MSPFNNPRKYLAVSPTVLRVVLIVISVFVLYLIVHFLVKRTQQSIVPIYADEVRSVGTLSRRKLISRIGALDTTIASYDAQLASLAVLRDENNKLKSELGRTPATKGILATVLTAPNRNFYDTFLIDAGSAESVRQGQTVFAFNSVALGTVSSVQSHSATVSLFSTPDQETPGRATGSDVAVTLIGRGNGEYEVRMPRDVHFAIGDSINYESTAPAVLATIEKILTDPRDPFQRLLTKAPVNLQSLKWVIVR